MINERQLLKPYQVQFAEEDREQYGDGWYVYDETKIIRLPVGVLVAYEQEIGAPLTQVMQGMRDGTVFGNLAAAWLAMRMSGASDKAGPFEQFSPLIMLANWQLVPEDDQGKDSPAEPALPSPQESTPDRTVVLDTSPPAGSGD
jgi:hypothetical protein